MINVSTNWAADISAPARKVSGKVLHYRASSLKNEFLPTDKLVSIKIEKTPTNGMFFGYTICQKATIVLLDTANNISIEKGDKLEVYLGTENELVKNPIFYVEEPVRDEVKKQITITAYDLLFKASDILQKELVITFPITLKGYADVVAAKLGTEVVWVEGETAFTNVSYTAEQQPNFGGAETLREILTAIAGASGSICYVNADNKICFKQLINEPKATINKDLYFELTLGKPITLSQITHATELGDNITAGNAGGYNQIIRNNPFLENREDITDILLQLLNVVNGTTIYHYSIKWRANPAIEIGDCLNIDEKNIYYLGETINYIGGMSAKSEWKDAEQETVEGNPATLGEALNKTFAKVDKINNKIELVAGNVSDNTTAISNLQIDAGNIKASVSTVQNNLDKAVEDMGGDIDEISKKVELAMTDEDVQIKIEQVISEGGVKKVETTTGYKFDETGLTVSKTGSEMTTTITEDGMTVYRDNTEVLIADNEGVWAEDLHATTYLIIGENSRFEDYDIDGERRTACFWIGGIN